MARAMLTTASDFKELPIQQGAVAFWLGSNATAAGQGWEIANGAEAANDSTYTRSDLRAKYLKAAASGGATGGAVSHLHTWAHDHGSVGGTSGTVETRGGAGSLFVRTHNHASTTAGTATFDLASNDPASLLGVPLVYTRKANATRGSLTREDLHSECLPFLGGIFGLTGAAAVQSGYALCDGSTVNGYVTPNLIGYFLRGVAATGDARGGTDAGTLSHTHTGTSHAHTCGGADSNDNAYMGSDVVYLSAYNHTHSVSSASSATSAPASTAEPEYITVRPIAYVGSSTGQGIIRSADVVDGMTTMKRGLVVATIETSLPSGVQYADGSAWANGTPSGYGANRPDLRDKFLKSISGTGDGGGSTGSHAHSHAGGSHGHDTATATDTWETGDNNVGDPLCALSGHKHALATGAPGCGSVTGVPAFARIAWVVRD